MQAARQARTDLSAILRKPGVIEPCNKLTARCGDARSYFAVLRPCCRGHVIQMVTDIQRIFDEKGVCWWADYGTLLGAVRNPMTTWASYPWLPQDDRPEGTLAPGIIPHDKDADLGYLAQDHSKVQRSATLLRRLGYHVLDRGEYGLKVKRSRYNHTNVDVFSWHERPSGVLFRSQYLAIDAFKGREFPKSDLLPLSVVEWEGMEIPAPRDPEKFCEFRYGPNWMTPLCANNDRVAR